MTDEELKRLLEANAELEQALATLEDRFVGLQARVDRLEGATKTEN